MADTALSLVRLLSDHRRRLLPLVGLLAINLAVWAGFVYPLSQRVANIEQRDRAADTDLRAAQADFAQVSGALSGKARATEELATFYKDVLPADLTGARRLTHLRLAQMAREANLTFLRSSFEPVTDRDRTLTRLKIEMSLAGSYADMRRFLHALETAPEFVVIDNVELAEGAQSGPLGLTLHLSTYYREQPS